MLFYLLVALFFKRHNDHVLLVHERIVDFFILFIEFVVNSISNFTRIDFNQRGNLPFCQVVGNGHGLLLEVHHHLRKLVLWRLVRVERHFLRHFCDNDIADIVVLEAIVLVAGFPTFGIPNGTVDHTVLITTFVLLDRLFTKTFFTTHQSVLVSIAIEMDDTQPTVDFDHLAPAGTASMIIEIDGFEFIGESVSLNQFVTSCIVKIAYFIDS